MPKRSKLSGHWLPWNASMRSTRPFGPSKFSWMVKSSIFLSVIGLPLTTHSACGALVSSVLSSMSSHQKMMSSTVEGLAVRPLQIPCGSTG